MKMKSIISILTLPLLIASCGGSGGGDSAPKDLFSLWNETTTNAPLDLTGGAFSVPLNLSFFFVGGAQCDCTFTVLGTQSSGTYVINSCSYNFGSGSGDPGCNALNETGVYTNNNNTLTATGNGVTSVYQ